MEPIRSRKNQRLTRARQLLSERRARAREGLFAVEGEDLVAAALEAGIRPVDALVAADAELEPSLAAALADVIAPVDADLLAEAGTMGHAARIVAVFRTADLPPAPPDPGVVLALFGVRDPGNVGTLLRSMAMLGPGVVAVGPQAADPLGPRAVRATMGAIFTVPLVRAADPDLVFPETRRIALAGEGTRRLDEVDLGGPVTVLVGSERHGLPPEVLARAHEVVRIPIEATVGVESLNAAMAGTIALYERRRAR